MSKNSMNHKNFLRKKTIAIAVFLTLTIAATMIFAPLVNAHTPPRIYAIYARVHIAPNPVGVGQSVIIVGLVNWALPGALYANDVRLKNYTITITKPDGITFVQKYDLAPDPGGSAFLLYTPDQVGNYTVLFEHHGTNGVGTVYTWNRTTNPELTAAEAANYGNIWLPASATATFTVQAEPVGTPLVVPLPTEYWTRPIEGQNWQWQSVSSNWLSGASAGGASISLGVATGTRWQQDGSAPRTPHVMWTKPIEFGGLVGGSTVIDSQTYYSGFSYETRFGNPIIISGVLYYRQPLGHQGDGRGYVAVDLRTGQEIWRRDDIEPDKGQVFDFQSPNQHGTVGGILWDVAGSTWRAYDAFTGKGIFNLTAVPNGYEVYDTRQRIDFVGATVEEATISLPLTRAGDITRYVISYNTASDTGWLGLWSVAKSVGLVSPQYGAEGWRANGNNINSSTAFLWNVTLPNLNGDSAPFIAGIIPGDIMLGASSGVALTYLPRPLQPDPWTMWALNLNESKGPIGQLLWIRNYTAPPGNITRMLSMVPLDPVNRVWIMKDFDTAQMHGYSIDNGDLLWSTKTDPLQMEDIPPMQQYAIREGFSAYGIFYVSGYGGEIRAYATNNGTLLWAFNDTATTKYNTGIPWGNQPLHASAVADGVVYAFAGEHSPNTPLYKGNRHFAVDAFTGEKIWELFGWSSSGLGTAIAPVAIADGYLTDLNAYDGQIYSIGKGPSATSVSASPEITVEGSSVLIKGTVTDISAGTTQPEQAARFPNGVAAVSDASMTGWMEYVYMQKPRPSDVTGVEVTLSVLDSNNNFREIGKTTSDSNGFFSFQWKPDITGKFTVYASFVGSEAYWPSQAETAFAVDPASPAPPGEPEQPPSMTDIYILAGVAAIIIAIAVVGALILLVLRKRP